MATNSRVPSSFGRFVKFLSRLAEGLEVGAQTDPYQKDFLAEVAKALPLIVPLDTQQEAYKARMKESTRKLNEAMVPLRDLVGRIVSHLDGRYGKKGDQIVRYGIGPRWFGGRKAAPPESPDAGAAA